MTLTLGQIADWIHAEGEFDSTHEATGYSIDSRTVSAGDLFFAVKGERVDGHDYVESAIANGAIAAVVSLRWLAPAGFDECMLLRVPDDCDDCVLDAMQKLARQVRRQWGKLVIGITGSAGKTTTKECVAAVLSAKFSVLKTEGNFNNHFGLPLQLLRLTPEHEIAVLEMGMNHAGEIAALGSIAEPNWGVVSNVGPVHLEHFADGIEGVTRAKAELIDALPPDGVAILNADDPRVLAMATGRMQRCVLYGTAEAADVRAVAIDELGLAGTRFRVQTANESADVTLHLLGQHNVLNSLAAIAAGVQAGIPLADCAAAIASLRPTEKRGELLVWNGARIINDCYNSNPKALAAMAGALARVEAKRRIVIAGEMLELGPEASALHRASGEDLARSGADVVVGVRGEAGQLVEGARAGGVQATFVESPEDAGAWMREHLREGDVVLVKASRGVRLERALALLPGIAPAPEPS